MISLREKEIDPELLNSIDKTKTIIFCTPPDDRCLVESPDPDIMSILLTQDINLSTLSVNISTNVIAIEYKPRIKILMPVGLRLNICETRNGQYKNIFDKIYANYDTFLGHTNNEELSYYIFENFVLTVYIDVIQMRKKTSPLYLNKGEPIADVLFSWYIQTKTQIPMIEKIYYIKDLYLYQEFSKTI